MLACAPLSSTVMRLASTIALALMTVGCATLVTPDEEIARTCGIESGWHQLKGTPANSSELLSLAATGKRGDTEMKFSPESMTHKRWFGKGESELAYCQYQVVRGSCDWPNQTVLFQKANGRWTAEQRLPTVCVSGNP